MIQNKETLKGYFSTGDKPTQTQFENLIDSLRHAYDKIPAEDLELEGYKEEGTRVTGIITKLGDFDNTNNGTKVIVDDNNEEITIKGTIALVSTTGDTTSIEMPTGSGQVNLNLPTTSGTIALTSQIPTLTNVASKDVNNNFSANQTFLGDIIIGENTNQKINFDTSTIWNYYLQSNGNNWHIDDSDGTKFIELLYNSGGNTKSIEFSTLANFGNNVNIGGQTGTRPLNVFRSTDGSAATFLSYTDSLNYQGFYIDVSQATNVVTLKSSGTSGGGFDWQSGNTSRMTLSASGQLDVFGSGTFGNTTTAPLFMVNSATGWMMKHDSGNHGLSYNSTTGRTQLQSSGSIALETQGTNVYSRNLFVDGISTISSTLGVNGLLSANAGINASGQTITAGTITVNSPTRLRALSVDANSTSDIASFENDHGYIELGHTTNLASIDVGTNQAIRFRQGSAVPVTIATNSFVGVNKTNPTKALDVSGEGRTSGLFTADGGMTVNGRFLVTDGDTNKLETENLGLIVKGNSATRIILDSATGNDTVISFDENGVQKAKLGFDSSDNLFKIIGSSEAFSNNTFTLDSNGNSTQLGGATFGDAVRVNAENGNGASLTLGRVDTNVFWTVNHAGGDFRLYNHEASGSDVIIGLDAGSLEKENRLGIGITPTEKLHVNGNGFFNGTVKVEDTIKLGSSTGSNAINSGSLEFLEDIDHDFDQSNAYGFRFNYNGNENLFNFQSSNSSGTSTIFSVGRDNGEFTFQRDLAFNEGFQNVTSHWYRRSIYHATNGILIATNIDASTDKMIELIIEGNSYFNYNSTGPIISRVQAYNYTSTGTIVQTGATSNDPDFKIDVFHYNGKIYFWFEQTSAFQTYSFRTNTGVGSSPAKITNVSNAAKPSTGVTNNVSITPIKTLNSANVSFEDISDRPIWNWSSARTDINSLTVGSTFGTIYEGVNTGHVAVGIRGNDPGDSFWIFETENDVSNLDTYTKAILRVNDSYFQYNGNNVVHTGNMISTLQDSFVTISTNQTITGDKTFTGSLKSNLAISVQNSNPTISLKETDLTDQNIDLQVNGGQFKIYGVNDARDTFNEWVTVNASNGLLNANAGITSTGGNTITAINGTEFARLTHYGIEFERGSNYLRPTINGSTNLYIGGSAQEVADWSAVKIYSDNGVQINDQLVATQVWTTSQLNNENLQTITNRGSTTTNDLTVGGLLTADVGIDVKDDIKLLASQNGTTISPRYVNFTTNGSYSLDTINEHEIGGLLWNFQEPTTTAGGNIASIKAYITDTNQIIQGSASESSRLDFNLHDNSDGTGTYNEHTVLSLKPDATSVNGSLYISGLGTESSPSLVNIHGQHYSTAGDARLTLSQNKGGSDLEFLVAGVDSRSDGLTANDQYIRSGQRLRLWNRSNGSTWNTRVELSNDSIQFSTGAVNSSPSTRLVIDSAGTSIFSGDINASGQAITAAQIIALDNSESAKLNYYGVEFDRTTSYLRPTTNLDKDLWIGGITSGVQDWNSINIRGKKTNFYSLTAFQDGVEVGGTTNKGVLQFFDYSNAAQAKISYNDAATQLVYENIEGGEHYFTTGITVNGNLNTLGQVTGTNFNGEWNGNAESDFMKTTGNVAQSITGTKTFNDSLIVSGGLLTTSYATFLDDLQSNKLIKMISNGSDGDLMLLFKLANSVDWGYSQKGTGATTGLELKSFDNTNYYHYAAGSYFGDSSDESNHLVLDHNLKTADLTGQLNVTGNVVATDFLGNWNGKTTSDFVRASGNINETITGDKLFTGSLISMDNDLDVDGGLNVSDSVRSDSFIEGDSFRVNGINIAPTTSSENGKEGELRFTSDYIYVCVADHTWKRVALSTF